MSPLRRMWLAWGGRWEVPAAALVQWAVIAGLVVLALRIPGRDSVAHPLVADHLFVGFLLLPFVVGWRLRDLLGSEGQAFSTAHASWVLRWFFAGLVPLIAASIALPLLVVGMAPSAAGAIAMCTTVLGAWLGFARTSPVAGLAIVVYLQAFESLRPQAIVEFDIVTGVLAIGGCRRAWLELSRHPWRESGRFSTRLGIWLDALLPREVGPVPASAGLPTATTAARIGLSSYGGRWTMRLASLLGMAAIAFCIARFVAPLPDCRMFIYAMLALIAFMVAVGWAVPAQGSAGAGHAAGIRGILAQERLLPLTRGQGAASTLLYLIIRIANVVVPASVGGLIGLGLAGWPLSGGTDVIGLLLLPPTACLISSTVAACVILPVTVPPWATPRWATIAVGMATLLALLLGPVVVITSDSEIAYPVLVLVIALVAAALLPVAWYRLANAELP